MFHVARVVAPRPETNGVDIVLLQDGRRFSGVQILAKSAGGDFGSYGIGIPTETGYEATTTRKRDIFAVVGFVGTNPVIFGFLFPQVTQMLFEGTEDKITERSMERHPSDVYSFIDGEGSFEWHHPSGAYIRIAEDPAFEDLEKKDYLEQWEIKNNLTRRVHIHVEQKDGLAWVDIDPDGNIVVNGPVLLVQTPKSIFEGNVTIEGSLNVAGAIGSKADVIAGDGTVSLLQHKHAGVQPGGGLTATATVGAAMPPADDFTPDGHLPASNP